MSEPRTFTRSYPVHLERVGVQEVTGRLVPYGVVAQVADQTDDGWDIYREGFRHRAFAEQAASKRAGTPGKVKLFHTHKGQALGHFRNFTEETDGLWGTAWILPSRADDMAALLEEGIDDFSVEFRLPGGNHTETDGDGVRWRVRAHLDAVALEPIGAYSTAQVIAYRAEADEVARTAKADADAEAEAAAAREAAAAAEDEERRRAEQDAEAEMQAAAERRRRWDELAGRFDDVKARQAELEREFGVIRTQKRWVARRD